MKKSILAAGLGVLAISHSVFAQNAAQPTLFRPGNVSTEFPEFGGTFSADGSTFWFNRTSPDRSKIALLETRFENGNWSAPALAQFSDSSFREIDPWVSPDGQSLFFSSNRPLPGSQRQDFNLWKLDLRTRSLVPVSGEANSGEDEVFCSVSKNGNLFFARFSGKKSKIWRAEWQNGSFRPAQKLEIPGTDTASIINPAISPDEKFLVFASGELGGLGKGDLFISRKLVDGTWSSPRNLGASINSEESDFAPGFSADGKKLIFTSERRGIVQDFPAGQRRPGDIYETPFDPMADDEKAIRQIHRAYVEAWLKNDAEGVMSLFEPAARITPSGMGRIDSLHNIRAFWFPNDGSITTIQHFENQVIALDLQGDLAFTAQKTMLDWKYQNGETRFGKIQHGYAQTVYRRQADGSWKIWRQTWTDVSSRAN